MNDNHDFIATKMATQPQWHLVCLSALSDSAAVRIGKRRANGRTITNKYTLALLLFEFYDGGSPLSHFNDKLITVSNRDAQAVSSTDKRKKKKKNCDVFARGIVIVGAIIEVTMLSNTFRSYVNFDFVRNSNQIT